MNEYLYVCHRYQVVTNLAAPDFANRLRIIGRKFIELSGRPLCKLDFIVPTVKKTNACGTIACHGGWLYELLPEPNFADVYGEDFQRLLDRGDIAEEFSEYIKGALKVASFLGLRWSLGEDLKDMEQEEPAIKLKALATLFPSWAHQNPMLWGNCEGLDMFLGFGWVAFSRRSDECTLKDVGRWYLEVADRVSMTGRVTDPE